jgi:Plasmid replication region DNA-binding N-term
MITYEQVRDLVAIFKSAGVQPSRKKVRARIGEGSYETIGRYIDRARIELDFPAPVSLVEDDEPEDDPPLADDPPDTPPIAGYTPPTPDPALIAQHLDTLRIETAITAAHSHLAGLCAVVRCLGPALARVQPHLHQAYLRTLLAAGPLSPATVIRPPYQEPLDHLTSACTTMLQAAEQLLNLLEPIPTRQEDDHGQPAA